MFTHLHLHTEYSLLDGACRIGGLFERLKEIGQTSVAITDHGALYGVIDFYKAAKAAGIKPIIGCEVYVAEKSRFDKNKDDSRYHLILLCKNETGWKNLTRLVSASYVEGFYIKPRVDHELLERYSEGLICLSACMAGEVARALLAGDYETAKTHALYYKNLFPDYYLEMQDHGIQGQNIINAGVLRLSKELDIPVVATNDCHYLRAEDAEAQDILMCIQTAKTVEDTERLQFQGQGMYVKSEDEMRSLFPKTPEAIENTQKIADLCELDFEFHVQKLPRFELPESETNAADYLRKLCEKGYKERFSGDIYLDRLAFELDMIERMGYVDYFLIVSDFIAYAKGRNIPVGPGRGSAAGSIVSYTLGITDVDPMKYGLYFERFLNPDRVSMPDIDIDFCVLRRQEVIDYVKRKYGEDHVAQIVTFGTLGARSVVRDVARALNFPYSEADTVAKLIPFDIHQTLDNALAQAPRLRELYNSSDSVKKLIDTAKKLEGMPRHASTHAAGVLITAERVDNFVPLARNGKDESIVTQFPMTTLEELGLLKMDFLGLRNLTIIDDAARSLGIDITKIPEDDAEVFAMISEGKTSGVFQLESAGMTGVCMGLKPQSIEDITAVIALFRPGPMASIPRFIDSKHNPEKVTYKHPLLEDTLRVTYGCIVYQEQVLEIMRRIGGFSLGHADIVRRAMSKKKYKELERERFAFVDGAKENGVPERTANEIFDEIMDFANYAFNKAHAVCYAVIAYQTAYLKVKYPREYFAALLTSVLGWTGKVAEYVSAAAELDIRVLAPDINRSVDGFSIEEGGIRFGLAAVKNIGSGFIKNLIAERERGGDYKDLRDFIERASGFDLNKRFIEALIMCGAMDGFGRRKQLMQVYEAETDNVADEKRKKIEGQYSLFDAGGGSAVPAIELPDVPEYDQATLLSLEKQSCGLYFSGHPLDSYAGALRLMGASPLAQLLDEQSAPRDGATVSVGGLAEEIKFKTTKNGSQMAYITLEDATGAVEILVFASVLNRASPYVIKGLPLFIKGKFSLRDEKDPQILADEILPLDQVTEPKADIKITKLYIKTAPEKFERVKAMLSLNYGEVPSVIVCGEKKYAAKCDPNDLLMSRLKKLLGDENVKTK